VPTTSTVIVPACVGAAKAKLATKPAAKVRKKADLRIGKNLLEKLIDQEFSRNNTFCSASHRENKNPSEDAGLTVGHEPPFP
jgi:hypothetical protein